MRTMMSSMIAAVLLLGMSSFASAQYPSSWYSYNYNVYPGGGSYNSNVSNGYESVSWHQSAHYGSASVSYNYSGPYGSWHLNYRRPIYHVYYYPLAYQYHYHHAYWWHYRRR